MLSYQHAYHVGNFADVLKHTILIETINYLKLKEKPLCFIDTHAGAGHYRLHATEASKNKEFLGGIGKLWQQSGLPASLSNYVDLIAAFNPSLKLTQYPGSPAIATHLLGNSDRLFFYELHPAEFRKLNQLFSSDKRCKLFCDDGLKASLGLFPPKEHRALVLIDPSFEIKTEYQSVVDCLKQMHRRFSTGCYLLWYPVVSRKRNLFMERCLRSSGIRNIQLFELGIQPDSDTYGMTASGIIAINPPWTLLDAMNTTLPWLANALAENNQGHFRAEQLVPE